MGEEEDNIDIDRKQGDTLARNLHFALFFLHFCIVIIMIVLLAFGLGSMCCTLIFIVLLFLNILFFWHRRKIYRIRREQQVKQISTYEQISNLPKVYDFYCPKCLYQTNEQVEICPNCETGNLMPTTKNPD